MRYSDDYIHNSSDPTDPNYDPYHSTDYSDDWIDAYDKSWKNRKAKRHEWKTQHVTNYSYFREAYDIRVDLATRIKQLVGTMTGRNLELVNTNDYSNTGAWGIDDKCIYYNGADIREYSDDEILGKITHILALDMYAGKKLAQQVASAEPQYKELLAQLEDARSNRTMQNIYTGTGYYASALWERTQAGLFGTGSEPQGSKVLDFLQAINFHANADEFPIADKKTAEDFKKCAPLIEAYLEEPDFVRATKIYDKIKKFYPQLTEQDKENFKQREQEARAQARSMRDAKGQANKSKGKQPTNGKKAGFEESELEKTDYNMALYNQIVEKYAGTIGTLQRLLQSILKDNREQRYIRPYKRGKLDTKSVYKLVATGNMRVFKRPTQVSKKEYGMAIMVDQSGSMQGMSSEYSRDASIVLAEVFNKLGMEFSVSGFNYDVVNYKGFNENVPRTELLRLQRASGGTNDYNAMNDIKKQLNTLKHGTQSAVFVITDGMGNGSATKEIVNDLEKTGLNKIFGIGIGGVTEEMLDSAYNHKVAVNDVKELPMVLANMLKAQFRRGV